MTTEHDSPQLPDETPEQTIARLEANAASRAMPAGGGVTPLVPRPIVTVIALLVTTALVGHLFYDAIDDSYEGWRITMALGILVFFVLGGDVSKWLRRGGG